MKYKITDNILTFKSNDDNSIVLYRFENCRRVDTEELQLLSICKPNHGIIYGHFVSKECLLSNLQNKLYDAVAPSLCNIGIAEIDCILTARDALLIRQDENNDMKHYFSCLYLFFLDEQYKYNDIYKFIVGGR